MKANDVVDDSCRQECQHELSTWWQPNAEYLLPGSKSGMHGGARNAQVALRAMKVREEKDRSG